MTVNDRLRSFLRSLTDSNEGTVNDLQNRFYKGLGEITPDPDVTKLKTDVGSLQTTVSNLPIPPSPSNTMPASVAVNGLEGTSNLYARADHTHAARVQRKIVTLDTNGNATWTFTRPFLAEPSLQYMVFQSTGDPIVVEAQAWVMEGSNYVGVTIKGSRSQRVPVMQPLNVLAILGVVTAGVNTLVAALSGYNPFGGSNLTGVKVHLSAGDQM